MTTLEKRKALDALRAEIMANKQLPLIAGTNLVFGEGDPDAHVMFIGEAPGAKEDQLGRPFVGRSGQLLDRSLEMICIKRPQVYISNIVKRRPPENRDPTPDEIAAYAPYLARQIDLIAPQIIATLGRFSMNFFLPEGKISRDHGQIFAHSGRTIFPLFHPAAALRGTATLKLFESDFLKLRQILEGK